MTNREQGATGMTTENNGGIVNESRIETQPLKPMLEGMMKQPVTRSEVFSPDGCDIKDLIRYSEEHPEEDQDLISGLFGPDMTVVWGDPKAGKSIFTLQSVFALAVGDQTLWELPIPAKRKVALVTTDSRAHMEAAAVVKAIGADRLRDGRIRHWHAPQGIEASNWRALAARICWPTIPSPGRSSAGRMTWARPGSWKA